MTDLIQTVKQAKACSYAMAQLSTKQKNEALKVMAALIHEMQAELLSANAQDLKEAQNLKVSGPLVQRLGLNQDKLQTLVRGVKDVIRLPDPCHQNLLKRKLAKGLTLKKVSVPLGVVAVIFESRPDVIPQVLSLMLKSGNVCLLKGGREAMHSNRAFMKVIEKLNQKCKFLPKRWATLIETREQVQQILSLDQEIDLIIPRGSNEMIQSIMANTKIPVLGHADGVCHIFVDEKCDEKKAIDIILDAKAQYPSACNSVETILIHKKLGSQFLPKLIQALVAKGVEIFGCAQTQKIYAPAKTVQSWHTEYGDLKVSIRIVESVEEAIQHINLHGSHHSDAILTKNKKATSAFCSLVDSASVMVNASTRFADGFRYGFGAEVGISTNKTHARGPVGLEGLVIYKYVLLGTGQTVAQYRGPI